MPPNKGSFLNAPNPINPYKTISYAISDEELPQLVKEFEALGKPIKYNVTGQVNRTQFNNYVRDKRLKANKIQNMDQTKAIEESKNKFENRQLTDEEVAEIGKKVTSGEISMEDGKKVLLYKYKDDPAYMCVRLFRSVTLDRATNSPTPAPAFHRELFDLYQKHPKLALASPRGHGKAQSLDSQVLTPSGFKRIGDLTLNDFVIGADGKKKKVLALHPIEEMDLYRLSTRDGRSTLCNLDHLWNVQTPSNTGKRIVTRTTRELISNLSSSRFDKRDNTYHTEFRHFLLPSSPIEFEEKNLPIDPYVLGAWLGDGNSADARFTTADIEILTFFSLKWRKGAGKYVYGLLGLHKILRENNLLKNKHIPDVYLLSSIPQREALLQGLLDTDGCVSSDGMQVSFSNKNKRIIDSTISLIRSLGGTTTLLSEWKTAVKNGPKFHSFRIVARLPDSVTPFRLSRKAFAWRGSIKTKTAITNISFEKRSLGRCITVEDDLYITDDYLVTHNSTVTSFFWVLHQVLFQKKKFVVLISATEDLAVRFLRDIKTELETNRDLIWLFGYQKNPDKWSEHEITLVNGCRIIAKGRGGQMRGLKDRGSRPDLIVCDDLEDSELVRSEIRRMDLEEWFNGDVLPTLEPSVGQIIFIGTILHMDSLLNRLLDHSLYPDFVTKRYSAIISTDPPQTLWPERFSFSLLDEIKKSYISRGQLATFFMEYMNDPVPDEGATFTQEMVQYYDNLPSDPFDNDIVKELFIDLGGGGLKKTADPTAMVVLCTDRITGNMYVEDYISKRLGTDTDLIIQHIRDLTRLHDIRRIYIEKTQAVNLLASSLDRATRHFHLPPIEYVIPTRGSADRRGMMSDGKFQRIAQMEAPIRIGQIKFKRWMSELVEQLMMFPRGQHDDILDALSYGFLFAKKKKRPSQGKQFRPETRHGYLNRNYST